MNASAKMRWKELEQGQILEVLMYQFAIIKFFFSKICHVFEDNFEPNFDSKKKVQVGKDQEKAQSEKDSLQKPRWEKTKLTIRYLYHETYRKSNEQLFSQ